MSKITKKEKVNSPKPEKTKLYLGTLILSIIPFVGLAFALNGFIRSTNKVIKSRKAKRTDRRAIIGIVLSSIALFISLVAINAVINPVPGIYLAKMQTNVDGVNYVLSGTISNMDGEASKISINDIGVPIKNGEFSYKVDLKEGDNTFNLVATNHNGETKRAVSIHRTTKAEFAARAEVERLAAKKKTEADAKIKAKADAEAKQKAAVAAKAKAKAKAKAEADRAAAEKRAEEEHAEEKQQPEKSAVPQPAPVATPYSYEWINNSTNSYYLLISNFDNSISDFKNRIKATVLDFSGKVSFMANTMVLVTDDADVYRCETLTGKPGYTIQKYIDCFNQAGGKDAYNAKVSSGDIALYCHEQSYASNISELIFYPDALSSHEYAKYKETLNWKP